MEIILIIAFVFTCVYLTLKNTKKVEKIYNPVPCDMITSEEIELVRLINEYRLSIGLGFVSVEKLACELCDDHVQYMETYKVVNHDSSALRHIQSKAYRSGEICSGNIFSPKAIFTAYLHSPTHKAIIVDPIFTHLGISTSNGYNCIIFTNYKSK